MKVEVTEAQVTTRVERGPITEVKRFALGMADLLERQGFTVAAAEMRRLVAQRDALLEALKTVEWHGQGSCWVVNADKIAAAIAKAEENT